MNDIPLLTLVSHALTQAQHDGLFPSQDDELSDIGLEECARFVLPEHRRGRALVSPSKAAEETARHLGFTDIEPEHALREIEYGSWSGHGADDVGQDEISAWLAGHAPHGGETIAELVHRVAGWMESIPPERLFVITHQSLLRACIVVALDAPVDAFWRIDVRPLSPVSIRRRGAAWAVQW